MQQGNNPNKQNEKGANEHNLEQEKKAGSDQIDTAPDEFIAPNADTDQPLDGKGVVNDAVLGGEDHKNDNFEKKADK